MFPQRPRPPMNSRGFFPQQGHLPMGRPPFQGPNMMRGGQFGQQMPTRSGGLKGLLSRIIPGSKGVAAANPQGFIQGATTASRGATGALQGLTNPANISGMLGNVQKVLGMAQQVTPMVQQYGPLVQNFPAMLKIYRELKNSGDDETDASSTEQSTEVTDSNEEVENHTESQSEEQSPSINSVPSTTSHTRSIPDESNYSSRSTQSKPKLYI